MTVEVREVGPVRRPDVADRGRGEQVLAWKPALAGVSEVFHARFVNYRYPPHVHDSWAVIVVDQGAIRYDLERRSRGSDTSAISVLPPHVVHDGRAATFAGFTKRVAYLDTSVLPIELIGRGVDRSEITDDALREALCGLHRSLCRGEEALAGEERLVWIARRIRRHLGEPAGAEEPPSRDDAAALRDFLAAHASEQVTLATAGAALGRSTGHLARSFRAAYALSPHAFVVGLRVEHARRLLLEGCPPARAATESGFYDQAHLHRHFRRHTGTTPGRFAGGRAPSPGT